MKGEVNGKFRNIVWRIADSELGCNYLDLTKTLKFFEAIFSLPELAFYEKSSL